MTTRFIFLKIKTKRLSVSSDRPVSLLQLACIWVWSSTSEPHRCLFSAAPSLRLPPKHSLPHAQYNDKGREVSSRIIRAQTRGKGSRPLFQMNRNFKTFVAGGERNKLASTA